uniref:Peptidase S8/S53 domain-containing protein n=1 Tax=Solanum lycopersicum TaxID=4081 RepID=A0A3Q7GF83_SOLLC
MDDKGESYFGGVDILAGIDDAIKDGVDVLSASFSGDLIDFSEVDTSASFSVMGIGSFHAASHGIPFVVAGGNDGPDSYTDHTCCC